MSSSALWVRQHRLTSFFVLAYVLSWTPWVFDSAGLSLGTPFFPGGPLVVAVAAVVGFDRAAWRRAPESAIDTETELEPVTFYARR